jgi:hypothetical protein
MLHGHMNRSDPSTRFESEHMTKVNGSTAGSTTWARISLQVARCSHVQHYSQTCDYSRNTNKLPNVETLIDQLWTISVLLGPTKSSIPLRETTLSRNSGIPSYYACPLPAAPKSPCVLALLILLSTSAASRIALCTSVALFGCSAVVRFAGDNGRTCCCF